MHDPSFGLADRRDEVDSELALRISDITPIFLRTMHAIMAFGAEWSGSRSPGRPRSTAGIWQAPIVDQNHSFSSLVSCGRLSTYNPYYGTVLIITIGVTTIQLVIFRGRLKTPLVGTGATENALRCHNAEMETRQAGTIQNTPSPTHVQSSPHQLYFSRDSDLDCGQFARLDTAGRMPP